MVTKVNNNDLNAAREQKTAVVDFSAVWCGPCKMLAPVVDELSEEMSGQASFYNVDVDENPDLASEFGVMNIPTVILLKDGKEAARMVGFQPKQQVEAWIKSN